VRITENLSTIPPYYIPRALLLVSNSQKSGYGETLGTRRQ
jgi:hypothetical protein